MIIEGVLKMEKILSDELIERIEAIMPYGSGINYDYEIRGTKDKFYVYYET